ncbi:MAG: AsmA family protein [Opitutaceae bacterium]
MHLKGVRTSRSGGALKGILIVLAVLIVVLVVGWILFLPALVKGRVRSISGFPVEASRISANPFGATVLLEDFQLNNPEQFPVDEFVDVGALDLRIKPLSLMGDRVEIPQLVIDLEKLTFVTNKEGVMNANLLKQNIEEALGPSDPETGEEPARPFHVGVLQVKLGAVEVIDFSKSDNPQPRVVQLNVDRTFTDVTDPKVVIAPIMSDILQANLPGIANQVSNFLPEEYSDAVGSALKDAGSILGDKDATNEEKAKAAAESAKKLFDSLKGDNKP